MIFIDSWEDDHCPCCSFTHKEREFSVWWSNCKTIGQIEMVSDDELSLKKFLNDKPQFAEIIQNPVAYYEKYMAIDVMSESGGMCECSLDDNGDYNFFCEVGMLTYNPNPSE